MTHLSSQPTPRRRLVGFGLVAGLLLGLSLLASPVSAATASITQSGGTTWEQGEQVTLRWSSDLADPVTNAVYIKNEDSGEYYMLGGGTSRSGSHLHVVGDSDVNDESIPPGRYRAKVDVTGRVSGATVFVVGQTGIFTILGSGSCSLAVNVYPTNGSGGTVSPVPGTTIRIGESRSVTATARPGYVISSFSVGGVVHPSATGKVIYTGAARCLYQVSLPVNVVFVLGPESTIDSSADLGSEITPLGRQTIRPGETKYYRAIAKTGYEIWRLLINGSYETLSVPASSLIKVLSYRVAPQSIRVESRLKTQEWTIVSSIVNPEGGSITPQGTTKLPVTTLSQGFSIKPNSPDWVIEEVKIDGQIQPIKTYYTINYNLNQKNRTIQVKFKLACLDVTPEQTLSDLSANKQTYINLPSFREWANKNKELVNYYLYPRNCYLGDDGPLSTPLIEDMRKFESAVEDENFPVIASFRGRTRENKDQNFSAVITSLIIKPPLSVPTTLSGSTPYTYTMEVYDQYQVEYTVECVESKRGDSYANCKSENTEGLFGYGDDFKLIGLSHVRGFNLSYIFLARERKVRNNLIQWFLSNHTWSVSDSACFSSWSEFNAKASILVKECPFNDTTTATAPATAPASGTTVVPKPPSLTTIPKDTTTETLAANLIKDGDFATSLSLNNWLAQGTTVNTVRGGAGVLTIEHNGTRSPSYYLRRQTVVVKPGATYEYGGKISATLGSKLTGMSDNICQIDVYSYPALDTNDISVRTSTGGWQNYSARVTIPAGQTSAQLRLLTGYALNGTCNYDDIYFREVVQSGYGLSATNTERNLWRAFWDQLAGLWSLPGILFNR